MNRNKTLRMGVLGIRGQAAKFIRMIEEDPSLELAHVYYPKPIDSPLPVTRDWEDLRSCDALIVSSPTPVHFEQLEELRSFQGSILIEKPAVSTRDQTLALQKWSSEDKSRMKINYNFWHSELARTIESWASDARFGEPLSLSVSTGHGFAYKEKYREGWRADINQAYGVSELVGVHFIHFADRLLGKLKLKSHHLQWKAKQGGPPESVDLFFESESGASVNLHHSYCCPFHNEIRLIGTDAMIEYSGNRLQMFGPRETFDSNGRFTTPPVIESKEISFPKTWGESLGASLKHFVETHRGGERFSEVEFDRGLRAMQPIFEVRDFQHNA